MRSRTSAIAVVTFCIAGLVLLAGCNGDAGYEIDAGAEPTAGTAGEMAETAGEMAGAAEEMTEEALLAKLEQADAADGEMDHVIGQCPGCGLAMEGSADHTVQAHGYEVHFCSADCKEHFSEDVEGAIARLEVPGAD